MSILMADEDKSIWRDLTQRQTDAATVDAADWLAADDPPPNPVVDGLIEAGESIAVVGSAKAGKSYMALQLALCIAAGIPFLGHQTYRRPVLVANLEIAERQYKLRLRRMVETLRLDPESLRAYLTIQNLKGGGTNWDRLLADADYAGAQVILVDPFYMIFEGEEVDENAVQDAINAMKKIINTGKTLITVFHAPKGFNGERALIDLISGSSRLARFPEGILGLLSHAEGPELRVFSTILRNFPAQEDVALRVKDGILVPDPYTVPAIETQASRLKRLKQLADMAEQQAQSGAIGFETDNPPQTPPPQPAPTPDPRQRQNDTFDALMDAGRRILSENGGTMLPLSALIERLRRETGKGENAVRSFIHARLDSGEWAQTPELCRDDDGKIITKGRKAGGKMLISTPQFCAKYREAFSTLFK